MKRTAIISIVLAAVLLVGATAGTGAAASNSAPLSKRSATGFLTRVVDAIAANDYGAAWETLHPAHQVVAPEAEYVACEELTPIPLRLASLVPLSSRLKRVAVAGLRGKFPGVVVTFRLRWADDAAGSDWTSTLTAAAVSVGGHWAWMLPRARYERYQDDACGL